MLFYTPLDIAIFLFVSNFAQSEEREVIQGIWEKEIKSIQTEYRMSKILFKRHIYFELAKLDDARNGFNEINELDILLKDTGQTFDISSIINEQEIIEHYFKTIKLELTYNKRNSYRKIKLRQLLKQFGYKRRSAKLVDDMRHVINTLGLKTYLKNRILCDIGEISIDDMIMLRLE